MLPRLLLNFISFFFNGDYFGRDYFFNIWDLPCIVYIFVHPTFSTSLQYMYVVHCTARALIFSSLLLLLPLKKALRAIALIIDKKDPWLYRTFSRYGLFGPPSLSLVYDQFDHPRPLHTVTISSLQWVGDERSEYTFSIMLQDFFSIPFPLLKAKN